MALTLTMSSLIWRKRSTSCEDLAIMRTILNCGSLLGDSVVGAGIVSFPVAARVGVGVNVALCAGIGLEVGAAAVGVNGAGVATGSTVAKGAPQ